MTKEELLDILDKSREEFMDSIDELSDETLEQPGVVGEWSIKDLMVHLSLWEAELIKLLWQARQGQKPTTIHFMPATDDEINARWYEETRERPLDRVLDDFEAVRRQTIRRVGSFSEKDLNDTQRYPWQKGVPLWKWIANDSFEHEKEHLEQIKTWLGSSQ